MKREHKYNQPKQDDKLLIKELASIVREQRRQDRLLQQIMNDPLLNPSNAPRM